MQDKSDISDMLSIKEINISEDEKNNNATKGDVIRIHSQIDDLRDGMSELPGKINERINDRIDEKIKLHKASCRASDVAKMEKNPHKKTFYERIREEPEKVGIPGFLITMFFILAEMGLIG